MLREFASKLEQYLLRKDPKILLTSPSNMDLDERKLLWPRVSFLPLLISLLRKNRPFHTTPCNISLILFIKNFVLCQLPETITLKKTSNIFRAGICIHTFIVVHQIIIITVLQILFRSLQIIFLLIFQQSLIHY